MVAESIAVRKKINLKKCIICSNISSKNAKHFFGFSFYRFRFWAVSQTKQDI